MFCARSAQKCKSHQMPIYGMIWGQVNLENVSKAGKSPMKQFKNSALTFEIMHAMIKQVMIMCMGMFGQAVLGLCK
jgi:hypothetical protein